jgi:hypothetical protein
MFFWSTIESLHKSLPPTFMCQVLLYVAHCVLTCWFPEEKYKDEAQANKYYMVQVPVSHLVEVQKITLFLDIKMFLCTEKLKEKLKSYCYYYFLIMV